MEIRWQQRYHNFQKALGQLSRFLERSALNEMEEQGLIQAFEYTFELAWKTMQDFLEEQAGYTGVKGPKPVIQQAFQDGFISNGEGWMEMLKDRNRTAHTYNEEVAKEITAAIAHSYYPLLVKLDEAFTDNQ